MKALDKSQEKINQICAALRDETLEPAQREAQEMIREAQKQADEIIASAKLAAEQLHEEAKVAIEKERLVFHSSLAQSIKQSLETLRQKIEQRFFHQQLYEMIEKTAAAPEPVAMLINAIVKALEKEGLATDLAALIPHALTPEKVNGLLLQEVLTSLRGQSVSIGNFTGGVQVKLKDHNLTLDVSTPALKELLASYVVHKDFRKMIFEDCE